jgi:hypothetical protein
MSAPNIVTVIHLMARPWVADTGGGIQIWRVVANLWNKQSRTAEKGGPPAWGLGEEQITHRKKPACYEMLHGPGTGSCEHSNEYSASIIGERFLTSWVTTSFSRTLLHGVMNHIYRNKPGGKCSKHFGGDKCINFGRKHKSKRRIGRNRRRWNIILK